MNTGPHQAHQHEASVDVDVMHVPVTRPWDEELECNMSILDRLFRRYLQDNCIQSVICSIQVLFL